MADSTSNQVPDPKQVGPGGKGKMAWFMPDESLNLNDRTKKLFEEYSKISPDEVVPHILKVRKDAWDVHPYPCIGGFCFLDMTVHDSDYYNTEMAPVVSGQKTYLDLGCGLGQDVRALVHDGAPPDKLYAADIQADFIALGQVLFRDADRLPAKFAVVDIQTLDAAKADEIGFKNKMDFIHMGAFLHLFNWEKQVVALKNAIQLLCKNEVGVKIIGRQVGDDNPGEFWREQRNDSRFHHNEETFKQLWKEVGEQTGTEWDVQAVLKEFSNTNMLTAVFNSPGKKLMLFKAVRTK